MYYFMAGLTTDSDQFADPSQRFRSDPSFVPFKTAAMKSGGLNRRTVDVGQIDLCNVYTEYV
jgi:hypothetical protein